MNIMKASELDYWDAKCESCKYYREHTTGITYMVCGAVSNDGIGLGGVLIKVEPDFVCGYWEQNDEE